MAVHNSDILGKVGPSVRPAGTGPISDSSTCRREGRTGQVPGVGERGEHFSKVTFQASMENQS